jgi:predicted secreted protein
MHWLTALAIYFVVWWLVLFAVLPWGTRPVADADQATGWRGAPEAPGLGKKMLATTAVAAVVWGLIIWAITSEVLSFRDGILSMPGF